jgi:hypothetical protein
MWIGNYCLAGWERAWAVGVGEYQVTKIFGIVWEEVKGEW